MRRTRVLVLSVLVALVALVGPATSVEAAAEPEHHSRYSIKRINATTYLFKGRVSTYPGGSLLVLKKANGIDRYTVWKQVRIRKDGAFSARLTGDRGDCFRMRINQANGYRTTVEDLGCIVAD